MISRLLSGDRPGSRVLSVIVLAALATGLAAPFLPGGSILLNGCAKAAIFTVVVASFDLLLGYTGIISFAHTMFFGIGAYAVGIALRFCGPTWSSIAIGFAAAALASVAGAGMLSAFGVRVRTIFFAMITLAAGSGFLLVVNQFYEITGGAEGRSFSVPRGLRPAFVLMAPDHLGRAINGTILLYYGILVLSILCFLAMLRIVNSPFGKVLQAIRENEFRCEALGYNVTGYRIAASCISAVFASIAGGFYALWLRYVGPDSTLSMQVMLDILLMVVIGGVGTLYGSVVGVAIFIGAENYLKSLIALASAEVASLPIVNVIVHPDRWMLWLGVLFVLSVYYFPSGIVGFLRRGGARRQESDR